MSETTLAERGWLSIAAAARYAGVRQETVRAAVCVGALDAYRTPGGGTKEPYRIAKADIDQWMRSQPSAREVMCGVG